MGWARGRVGVGSGLAWVGGGGGGRGSGSGASWGGRSNLNIISRPGATTGAPRAITSSQPDAWLRLSRRVEGSNSWMRVLLFRPEGPL